MSDFLSLAEHAASLNLPVNSIRNLISRGQWPARTVLLGNRRLVPKLEHDRLIATLLETGRVPFTGPETLDRIAPQGNKAEKGPEASSPSPRRRGRPRKVVPMSMGDVA